MSDIVERLRAAPFWPSQFPVTNLTAEAANEIEHLRARETEAKPGAGGEDGLETTAEQRAAFGKRCAEALAQSMEAPFSIGEAMVRDFAKQSDRLALLSARVAEAHIIIREAQQIHARILQEGCGNPTLWGDDLISHQQRVAGFIRARAITDDGATT